MTRSPAPCIHSHCSIPLERVDHFYLSRYNWFLFALLNCSFPAIISEVDTKYICQVLSIPSDPFQELIPICIYIFIGFDYHVILQDRWIEWVFLFYIWTGLPIFRWKKDAFRTFFVWFLSDLCPFQLRLLYYHFPSFPRDWKVIDQQFTTFQLFKKWQKAELCCLWYLILNLIQLTQLSVTRWWSWVLGRYRTLWGGSSW